MKDDKNIVEHAVNGVSHTFESKSTIVAKVVAGLGWVLFNYKEFLIEELGSRNVTLLSIAVGLLTYLGLATVRSYTNKSLEDKTSING